MRCLNLFSLATGPTRIPYCGSRDRTTQSASIESVIFASRRSGGPDWEQSAKGRLCNHAAVPGQMHTIRLVHGQAVARI